MASEQMEYRLNEIVEVTDFVANGSFASLKENVEYLREDGYAILARLVDHNSGWKGEKVYVSERAYRFLKKSFLGTGDIVIANVGANAGTVFRIPKLPKAATLGPNAVMVRPRIGTHKINQDFLYYYLVSPEGQGKLKSIISGSAQPKFNKTDLRSLQILLPAIHIQESAATTLMALDDKIALLRETNATLEAIAQALFKSWFVDFDPVRAKVEGRDPEGMSPEVADMFPSEFEDSELGAIPKGWRIETIGAIAQVIDCLHSKKPSRIKSGPTLLQLSNILDSGLMDLSDRYCISNDDYQKWIMRMEALPGDCLITNVGRVGAVAQMPEGEQAAMGRNMTGIRVKEEFSFPTFLVECLQSDAMRQEMKRKTDMGTILDALNVRSIPNLRSIIPDSRTARCFEQVARPLRARMEQNLKQIAALSELRDALLPRLMSGKLSCPPLLAT